MFDELISWFEKHKQFFIDNIPNFIIGAIVLIILIWTMYM